MKSYPVSRSVDRRRKFRLRGGRALGCAWAPSILLLAGACSGELVPAQPSAEVGAPAGPDGTPAAPSDPAGVGKPGSGDSPSVTGMPGGPPSGSPNAPVDCSSGPSVGSMPLKRISRLQYRNSLRDILGLDISLHDELDGDDKVGAFNSNIEGAVSKIHVDRYAETAELVATRALENNPELFDCTGGVTGDACATEQIAKLARRFFGRTATAEETTRLEALYTAVKEGADFRTAMGWVLQGLLQSPNFLYQVETATAPGVAPLSGPEVARRLAAFLWQSAPDEALITAAENGELATAERVGAQAKRMLADSRAARLYSDFHAQWLRFDGVAFELSLPDDQERQAVAAELEQFVAGVIGSGGNDIQALLTSRKAFLDATMAETYGVSTSGDELAEVELPETERAGLLTRAGFLAANPSVTARGVFVRKELMCQPPPPPPATVSTELPDLGPDATEREILAAHVENPACAGCHAFFDPIGVGFLNYDAHGKYLTMDEHGTIDDSGELDGFTFNGALELSAELSGLGRVQDCLAEHWTNYALARVVGPADKCSVDSATSSFKLSGGSVPALVEALTMTDAFRFYSSN